MAKAGFIEGFLLSAINGGVNRFSGALKFINHAIYGVVTKSMSIHFGL
jgi:hypothetical protein